MQPSDRQRELERLYEKRRKHVPTISISDDDHHVTEAIGSSYYEDEPMSATRQDPRPLSFVTSPTEVYEGSLQKRNKRNGSYFDIKGGVSQQRVPLASTGLNERLPSPTESGSVSPKRVSSYGSENGNGNAPTSPPKLSRHNSAETAVQQFPLNDIDYESSPAAVAQELSNLQAIRRMSMNVDMADPDLPSFSGGIAGVPTTAPNRTEDESDPSRLFWVPARLHPELAPKEFKTFVEDRVEKIRRRSGDADSLSPDGLERSGSASSSLRRKKSMLSRSIDTQGNYEDGAERLERKRSKHMPTEGGTQVDLQELEELVSDPAQMVRRMSMDTARRSYDSGIEVPATDDMPMLPPGGQSLKRSTRTTYRRGSLKKGERVPFSKRAQQRTAAESEDDMALPSPISPAVEEPLLGLTRVQTEPIPAPPSPRQAYPSRTEASLRWRDTHKTLPPEPPPPQPNEPPPDRKSEEVPPQPPKEEEQPPPRPQHRQFQSRLASGPGRTTAQLPGYTNTNPLPQIVETLPDGSKVPSPHLVQSVPERKSSHELPRPMQRGGAHMRPIPGREHQRNSTLDDISSRPSPLPGSGNTSTDALTMVPTFEGHKVEKKDSTRKSSWKWILGSDDSDKEQKAKDDRSSDSGSVKSSKGGKLTKAPADKARLDVLQSSIDGNAPSRGRESLVLSREDLRLDEERKKESKKSSEPKKEKEKESGLLSAIFGGKKKASDGDLKEKKRKSDRNVSPEPYPRFLKPDIDYNWTRFSILEERAIYRMAHIKLANPRRALYSQVLLSNFMYSYLAKVQMMHPQVQIPPAHQKNQQRGRQESPQQQQPQPQQQQSPADYNQHQQWQQQQQDHQNNLNAGQNLDVPTSGGAPQQRTSYEYEDDSSSAGCDTRSSGEYDYDHSYQHQQQAQHGRVNGVSTGSARGGGGGYSVAGSHDYLGYPKDKQPFGSNGLWDDDEKSEELW